MEEVALGERRIAAPAAPLFGPSLGELVRRGLRRLRRSLLMGARPPDGDALRLMLREISLRLRSRRAGGLRLRLLLTCLLYLSNRRNMTLSPVNEALSCIEKPTSGSSLKTLRYAEKNSQRSSASR